MRQLLRALCVSVVVSLLGQAAIAEDQAARLNGLTVYNKGVGGQNSRQGKARFERDVLSLKPDYVFIYYGLNDALNEPQFVALDQFIENLGWMVDRARAAGIKPVLCTIHRVDEEPLLKRHKRESYGEEGPNGKLDRYNKALRALADQKKVPLADFAAAVAEHDAKSPPPDPSTRAVSRDGVHLTPTGNRLLAQCFLDAIPSRLRGRELIVCLGDSVTWGAGAKGAGTAEDGTYPAMLRELPLGERGRRAARQR
jgi:lysophospholipase L1-like esterase